MAIWNHGVAQARNPGRAFVFAPEWCIVPSVLRRNMTMGAAVGAGRTQKSQRWHGLAAAPNRWRVAGPVAGDVAGWLLAAVAARQQS